FSSRRRHTRFSRDWSSDVCSSDLALDRAAAGAELAALAEDAEKKGVTTRGTYDVQGFRADADLMFWWVAETSEQLQEVYAAFRQIGRASCRARGFCYVLVLRAMRE